MLVYDITNKSSFTSIGKTWLQQIATNAPPNTIKMIVGNKLDKEDQRQVGVSR